MTGRGLARAAVLLAVLAFAPGWLDPFAPLKAALLVACGAAAAVWWLAGGAGPRDRVTAAAGVALLAIAASAAVARDRSLAWLGEIEQREGVATWLASFALFAAARAGHSSARERERTLDTVVLAALGAAAYALLQFAGGDPIAWGDATRYAHAGGSTLRPAGTLGNANLLGAVLAPALAIVVARLARGRGDTLTLGAMAAVLGAALAATLSRGAMLAALAGTAAALFAARAGLRRSAFAAAVALGPACAWSVLALRAAPLARFAEGPGASSWPARVEIARAALAAWRERPWLGVGPDGFGLAFPAVQTTAYWSRVWLGVPAHAPSAPLQLLVTLGVVSAAALALWAAFAVTPLVRTACERGARSKKPPRSSRWAWPRASTRSASAARPCWWCCSRSPRAARAPRACPRRARRSRRPPPLAGTAVLAFAWPGLAALAPAGRARAALEASAVAPDPALRAAYATRAAADADRALARRPFDDEPWRLAVDAHLAASRASADTAVARAHVAAALRAAREAQRLRPARAANALRLAQATAATGADATAAFVLAERAAPADAFALAEDVRDALARGDTRRALDRAGQVRARYPRAALGHTLAGAAWQRAGDRARALQAYRLALGSEWEAGAEGQRAAVQAEAARLAADSAAFAR
ncbi:MAG: O-antigen ligase family protein [Candidatus Eisenbacteria bacterium]